jgi:hypothetical protein
LGANAAEGVAEMPIEMTGEEKKAYEEFKIFQQKVIAQLEKERPEDLRDLMNPPPKKMEAYDSIIVSYFSFALWLCRFDDMMTRPLTVRINSYRFQRNKHVDDVMEQLGNIRGQRSGRALFDEIDSLGRKLYIYPFWKFANWPKKNPMFRPLGDNSTAKKIGNRDEKGRADAAIEYSASMWGESKVDPKTNLPTGTSGVTGAASEADDVLFHEMVHASREMRGASEPAQAVNQDYDDKEEFLSIVLCNVFLAEKGKHKLRANHHSHAELADPARFLANAQRVTPSPRQLLEQFFTEQQEFFKALAGISEQDAWWNPIRDLGREKKIVR